jgi:hypothetical protein
MNLRTEVKGGADFGSDILDILKLRSALGRFVTGVTVVTTRTPEVKL